MGKRINPDFGHDSVCQRPISWMDYEMREAGSTNIAGLERDRYIDRVKKNIASALKTKKPINEFTRNVVGLLLSIPRGKVVTYGQLAELAGKPNGSRQVAFILRHIVLSERVPWQRVIGSTGRIAIPKRSKHFKLQRKLLENEGVVFTGAKVNLDRYRWQRRPLGANKRAQPRMFSW